MIHEPNSFELRPITPQDEPVSKEESGEEDEGFLPSIRRASLDSVQSYELYTPDEDRTVLKKLDRRLVAFMALLYMLSFLDRSSEYFLHLEGSEGRYVRQMCREAGLVGSRTYADESGRHWQCAYSRSCR
jgi:hypothetical protein